MKQHKLKTCLVLILSCMLFVSLYPAGAVSAQDAQDVQAVTEMPTGQDLQETPDSGQEKETENEPETQEVPLEDLIYLDFYQKDNVQESIETYSYLNGTDAHLRLYGTSASCYEFLKAFSFNSLILEMPGMFLYYSDTSFKLADIEGLVSLEAPDSRGGFFNVEDVFEDLEELILTYSDGTSLVFGSITSRQMPALKQLTLKFDEASYFDEMMEYTRYYQLPDTLENVDIIVGEKMLDPEEISTQTFDQKALSTFLGLLAQCCPSVMLNNTALSELPAVKEEMLDKDQVLAAKASAIANGIVEDVRYGNGAGTTNASPDPVYGKLLFAQFGRGYSLEELSSESAEDPEGYLNHMVPDDMLASGLADADMLAVIYQKSISVGFYSMAGTAYQVDTVLVVKDLNTGTVYAPITIASNDPPSTITVTTVNGVPTGGSGYGEYEPEKAVEWVLSVYNSSIPGKAGEISASGEENILGISKPDADGGPSETAAQGETSANAADDDFIQKILDALDNPAYGQTLEALKKGAAIYQGTYSDAVAGLQEMLVDFGCDITVDKSAGPGTFGAVNQVAQAFGKNKVTTVNAALFEELLPLLLLSKDEEGNYEDLLKEHYDEEEGKYLYLKGCAYLAGERYYKALEAFEESGYGDYEERIASCEQEWPQSGEIWRNGSVPGQDMYLTFQVNSYDESLGRCFEVYTESGTLASVLFLTGSGSVTTYLPGGSYRIKNASGNAWYGKKDAFGRYGHYEFMSFNEFETDPYLTRLDSGYEWTITINVEQGNPESTGVDAIYSDWENWVE